ncbi:MAG: endolytic transglycosylase MltG [Alphaproteobacteria bacterium]
MRRSLIIAGVVVGMFLLAAVLTALYGLDRFEQPGPLEADTIVLVPRGAGVETISHRLEDEGIIDDPFIFRIGVWLNGATRDLRAGEYLFLIGTSMRDAMDVLRTGKPFTRRLTLPEGLTSAEAVVLINGAEALDGEAGETLAEGSLLPETYHYVRGDSRIDLVRRMQRSLDKALDELWPVRAQDLPLADKREAMILASIVEKETGVPEERSRVASVFVNRLRTGMRLQSDPTVAYGITDGSGPLGRPLTRQDLQTPSPYNTYLNNGLPPGPISNPGRAAIEAVLNPAETEYLYFVASGNGGHAFAKTLAEHNRNVEKWRKLRDAQN